MNYVKTRRLPLMIMLISSTEYSQLARFFHYLPPSEYELFYFQKNLPVLNILSFYLSGRLVSSLALNKFSLFNDETSCTTLIIEDEKTQTCSELLYFLYLCELFSRLVIIFSLSSVGYIHMTDA